VQQLHPTIRLHARSRVLALTALGKKKLAELGVSDHPAPPRAATARSTA
jgi:hypothetical protein